MKIKCDICKKLLKEPGALLFSPPEDDGRCEKAHICVLCYEDYLVPISKLRNDNV